MTLRGIDLAQYTSRNRMPKIMTAIPNGIHSDLVKKWVQSTNDILKGERHLEWRPSVLRENYYIGRKDKVNG